MHEGMTGFQHLIFAIHYLNSLCLGPAVPGHTSLYCKDSHVVKSGQRTRWRLWKDISTVGIWWCDGEAAFKAIP